MPSMRMSEMGVIRTYSKPRVCVVCGKPITSKQKAYCSVECKNKARVIQQRNDRRFAREMNIPYEIFVKKNGGTLF